MLIIFETSDYTIKFWIWRVRVRVKVIFWGRVAGKGRRDIGRAWILKDLGRGGGGRGR
jgi:hypothetical protein